MTIAQQARFTSLPGNEGLSCPSQTRDKDDYMQRLAATDKAAKAQDKRANMECLRETLVTAVFVIGTALVIITALRNSLTWHAQRFWGASGNFWQSQWERVYQLFDGNEALMVVLGTILVVGVTFWFLNLLLMIPDVWGKPAFILKYKIQEDKNVPVDQAKLWNAIRVVLRNQIMSIPVTYVFYKLGKLRGNDLGLNLPTFHWVLFELIVFVLVEEVGFYYSHRLVHTPKLYARIHKQHHEWTAPIGIIALYAHPLEHVMSNLAPVFAGPLIMGSHISTAWLWFALAISSTTLSHSGYHLPFLPSPEFHDFHHLKFNYCFGVLGIMDRLHGTDSMFRKSTAYLRHTLSLSLTPLSVIYPDKKEHKNGKEQ